MKYRMKCGVYAILLLFFLALNSISAYADFPHSPVEEESIPKYLDNSDYFIDINDGTPDFEIWQKTRMSENQWTIIILLDGKAPSMRI